MCINKHLEVEGEKLKEKIENKRTNVGCVYMRWTIIWVSSFGERKKKKKKKKVQNTDAQIRPYCAKGGVWDWGEVFLHVDEGTT
jgi:hypothetical protein